MLGFRGCRLPIVFPEIGDMQILAIIEAAIEVKHAARGPPRDHDPAGRDRGGTLLLKKRAIAVADEVWQEGETTSST